MKATYSIYDYKASSGRIKEILDSSDTSYQEVKSIPSRDSLTFTNGYYVYCSAMFVDMRQSKELVKKYQRPTLARIYRSYVSELVAVMKNHSKISEINIEGDCVWGIFDTPNKNDIDELFSIAAQVSSMINILNWRFEKKGYDPIEVGIGLDYGRALMIKAGYKGSSINNVVWMGAVVNEASKLCSFGSRSWDDYRIMVSDVFHSNLNENNKSLLYMNLSHGCYHGNVINTEMNNWLIEQMK
jgi:class 3 adenylate cyclase